MTAAGILIKIEIMSSKEMHCESRSKAYGAVFYDNGSVISGLAASRSSEMHHREWNGD